MGRHQSLTSKSLREKLECQQYKCALTGIDLTPSLSSLDHINPRVLGGDNGIDNVQVVLPAINRAKGTMTQEQFVSMCHAVSRANADCHDDSWVEWTGHGLSGRPSSKVLPGR